MTEAYSRLDWHKKWGIHYVPSLARAHVLQICTNFKDAGLQSYAGAKFCTIRDRAEAIFINLPAPTPSLSRQTVGPVSMSRYHDSNNPCFAAGKVRMADGTVKDVAEVLPGDQVATPCNGVATVACIVATRCNNGVADLVRLPGGVLVTPYHPVQSLLTKNSEWRFPCDLMEGQMCTVSCGRVYSFVLSPPCAGAMVIGQYGCVTLGHGMKGPVVGHPYLGTQAVLDDLSVMHGWAQGLVLLEPGPAVRHPTTCMIEGLRQEQGAEEQDMHDLRSVVVLEKPLLPLAACQG